MKLTQTIYEGERRPFGYGFVTYDFMRDGIQVAPMPINWIIRFIDWASHKSQRPLTQAEIENHKRVREEIQRQLHEHGTKRYTAGYEYGFKAGWQGCAKHALEQLDKERCRCYDTPNGIYYGDCPVHKHDKGRA